jgi:hypothetical protein
MPQPQMFEHRLATVREFVLRLILVVAGVVGVLGLLLAWHAALAIL